MRGSADAATHSPNCSAKPGTRHGSGRRFAVACLTVTVAATDTNTTTATNTTADPYPHTVADTIT